MKNYAKDIVHGMLPFLLYIALSQFEINYNAFELYTIQCNKATATATATTVRIPEYFRVRQNHVVGFEPTASRNQSG